MISSVSWQPNHLTSKHTLGSASRRCLNTSANIAKAFWGTGGKRTQQRQPLRDSIGVPDLSAFKVLLVRNHFEHFDERLDEWWEKSKTHNYVDMNINLSVEGFDAIDVLRSFRTAAGEVQMWGDTLNLRAIHEEILGFWDALEAAVITRPFP